MAKKMPEIGDYKYGFADKDVSVFRSERGLTREIVEEISSMKEEPQWMLDYRLKSLELFYSMPMPQWGGDLNSLNFDEITYYVKPSEGTERSWDEVPEEIKRTFDKLGIPEAEQKYLAGVSAQYESEVVYHNMKEDLEDLGNRLQRHGFSIERKRRIVQEVLGYSYSELRQQVLSFELCCLVRWIIHLRTTWHQSGYAACKPISVSTRKIWVSSNVH